MSHFDLPRINFHGTALLDTATANNGNYEPSLKMFDQNNSEAFLPPRCYLPSDYLTLASNPPYPGGYEVLTDENGPYILISPITADNYQQWAITPLGSFQADAIYIPLYKYLDGLNVTLNSPSVWGMNPGYWNYFGDLSMSLINTQVTGITLEQTGGGVVTYTPQNQVGCPAYFADMFGAVLSFNTNYFAPGSHTSAYLSDADSIGQMCTQIFIGQAGLYKTDDQNNQLTFFSGTPVKSTCRWMNLSKVLNYSDSSIVPMGGSACFYAMIELSDSSVLSKMVQAQNGKVAKGLLMKLQIHEVYEIREPNYKQLKTVTVIDPNGNQIPVPKNPAQVSVSGSISPYYDGDMTTASISRLLKNDLLVSIDTSKLEAPVTKNNTTLSVPNSVNLAPIQFLHNPQLNLISLDILNCINEYGTNPATISNYAGNGDIPPFQDFESYNFDAFTLWFQPDDKINNPVNIGSFDYTVYNMQQLLATGGMVDFIADTNSDYTQGNFYITLNGTTVYKEDDYLIISDQMGNYAIQNQETNNYMSDGLPKIPCTLRVFYRGAPVSENNQLSVTQQAIDIRTNSIKNTNISIYDGLQLSFPVDTDGCMTYAFVPNGSLLLNPKFSNLFIFVMNTSMVVLRTLSSEPPATLENYLNGSTTLAWEIVFNNVFSIFKVLYPVMDIIIPFTETNWSDPHLLNQMTQMTAESNWNQPLYMPVTRDLTNWQLQLLQLWTKQVLNSKPN